MNFVLYLIVNAILFLRPAELLPDLATIPLYLIAIVACILFSFTPVMDFFARSPMRNHPTFAMVLTMLLLAALSFYANSDKPLESLIEYLKVFTYFVLFLALVNTPARLRAQFGERALVG